MTIERPNRKSIRAPGYDYTAPGTYMVTICIEHRACVLGTVDDGCMHLNVVGVMIADFWNTIPARFPTVAIDEFAILPNHMHGILRFGWENVDAELPNGDSPSLGKVMQWFKSITTSYYGKQVEEANWTPYPGRLWQRNYFERIVRSESELERHRKYIVSNAAQWARDSLFNVECRGFR